MRASHDDFIDRWILFMKKNPNTWKKIHTKFINAQFEHAEEFYKSLSQTKEGRKKLIELYNIKNLKGYPSLQN